MLKTKQKMTKETFLIVIINLEFLLVLRNHCHKLKNKKRNRKKGKFVRKLKHIHNLNQFGMFKHFL